MAELTLFKDPARRTLGILKISDDERIVRLVEKQDDLSAPVILKELPTTGFVEAKRILDNIFFQLVEEGWVPDPDSFR